MWPSMTSQLSEKRLNDWIQVKSLSHFSKVQNMLLKSKILFMLYYQIIFGPMNFTQFYASFGDTSYIRLCEVYT